MTNAGSGFHQELARRLVVRVIATVLLAGTLLATPPVASAADATWSGVTYNGLSWITGANWVEGAAPGVTSGTTNTDIATFDNTGNQLITLPSNLNLGGITFATTGTTANPFYLSGGSLLTSANAVIQTASSYRGIADINTAPTLQGNLTLRANGQAGSGLFLAGAITTAASLGNVTLTLDGSNTGYNNQLNNIASGAIGQGAGSTLALRKTGAGSWYVSSANTYTGGTQLDGGLLATGNSSALGSSGSISVQSNSTLRTVAALTDPSSRLSIADGATLTFDTWNVAQSFAGAVATSGASNTAGFTKTGLNQLAIAPASAATVQTWRGDTTVNMGLLFISAANTASGATNLVDPNSRLVLGGGSLYFGGKASFTSSQAFNGTLLNPGVSELRPATSTGTNTLALGPLTRTTGGLLHITTGGGFTYTTTSANDSNGLIKGIVQSSSDFVRTNSGTLVAATYTTQNAAGSWTVNASTYQTNGAVSGTAGTGGTVDINGLKLNNASSQSFAINGTLRTSAGVIFGSSIGANTSQISGGSLTSTSGDLIIANYNVQNTYGRNTISATITDNGSPTNVILYNGGNGSTLYISGNNSYTGDTFIGGGSNAATASTVTLVGGAAGASIGSAGKTVYLNGGSGGNSNILRVGNGDATGDVQGTIRLENGRLSLNRTDTFTLSATVGGTAGGGYLSQDGTGHATLNLAAGANLFRTLTNNSTGTLTLQGSGVYVFDYANSNAASTTHFDSGSFYFVGPGNASNTVGTWNVAGANVTVAGGRYFNSAGGAINVSSGTFKVNGNALGGDLQSSGTITYSVSGGHFITSPNTNSGFAASFALGSSPAATGPSTFTQTSGEVTVGLPENATVSSQQFRQLAIGSGSSAHASTYALSGGVLRSFGGIAVPNNTWPLLAGGSNTFAWTGGRLTVESYNGTLLTSSNGVNSGTGTLFQGGATSVMAPGEVFNGVQYTGKTTITGNYQIDSGVLAIGIGGTTAATQFHNTSVDSYDNLSVTGATTFGGRLAVSLLNGYTPPADTSTKFNIVAGTAAGATGQFTNQMTASSGNARIVLADGISSLLVATNTAGSTANAGGLSSVLARTTALGGYKTTNAFSGANNASWDAANAASWQNFDPGSTPSPATQASNAIAVFADASSSSGTIAVGLANPRNIAGLQFSSTTARSYTISGAGSLVIDNTLAGGAASITDASSVGSAVNVPISLVSDLAASVSGSAARLSLGGNISGAGRSLSKTGPGMLVLGGSNSYGGTTTVSAGGLTIASTDSLPGWDTNGRFSVASGATLAVGNGVSDSSLSTLLGTTNLAAGSVLGFDTAAGNRTVAVALGDTPNGGIALVKLGTNALSLGADNTYSGVTTITAGRLTLGDGGTAGSVTGAIANAGSLGFNRSDAFTFANAVSGTGGLVQLGNGTVTITGANTYTGITQAGVLTAETGTGAIIVQGDQTAANGGWQIGTSSTVSRTVTFDAGSTVAIAAGRSLQVGSVGSTSTGTQALVMRGSGTNAGSLFVGRSGNVSMESGATWLQSGSFTIAAQGGVNSPTMTVRTGATLTYGGTSTILVNGSPNGGAVSTLALSGGTLLTGRGFEQTTGTNTGYGRVLLSGSGTIRLTDAVAALSTGSNAPVRFELGSGGGRIDTNGFDTSLSVGITGGGGLRKQGLGSLTLSGSSTYSGATAVDAGRLLVNGALGSGSLTVAAGATLGGSGSIGGLTSVAGLYSPGNSPGILTQSAGLDLTATSTTLWELWGNTAAAGDRGTLYDGIDLTGGALSIAAGSTLQLDFGTAGTSTVDWDDTFWAQSRSWTLVDVSGAATWGGSLFTSLLVGTDATGASLASKRPDASFSVASSGGDLTIEYVIVPEPGVIVLAVSGFVLAGIARARRRVAGKVHG